MSAEWRGTGLKDRYQFLIELAPDALLVIGARGDIVLVNAETEHMFGYQRTELLDRSYKILVPDRFKNQYAGILVRLTADPSVRQVGADLQLYGLRRNGTEFPVEISLSPLNAGWGREIMASVRDVTDRRNTDAELRAAMSLLSATLESTADGILVVTRDGRIAGSNERFSSMWGIPKQLMESHDDDRIMSFVMDQLVDPSGFVDKVRELYADPGAESNDVLEFRDGRTFERYSGPQRVDADVVGRVWSFRDVTPRRRAEDRARQALAELAEQAEELKLLAFRDPLTGLANRALFNDRFECALGTFNASSVSILLLDLDDFKEVNDVLGHQAGDQMLIEVGRRLRECVRPSDTVARLGGDEFVILLQDAKDPDAVAARVVAVLGMPMSIEGRDVRPSVSVGLAFTDAERLEDLELLRRADVAMYAAKAAGKNRYVRFDPGMKVSRRRRTDLPSGRRRSAAREDFIVRFQPVVAAADRRMMQVEALVRWQHPLGLVAPADFNAAAESSGLINDVGQEVLTRSCLKLRGWLARTEANSIAVNVCAVQLLERHFAESVLAVLSNSGVRPRQLVLEITERVFHDPAPQVIDQLVLLRASGVLVSIGDFGTGHPSPERLQGLPVDALKIGPSLVGAMAAETEGPSAPTSLVTMAHALGLHVTAEGVDTEERALCLLAIGCDALQGDLFSGPQTIEDLPEAGIRSTAVMQRLQPGPEFTSIRARVESPPCAGRVYRPGA